MRAAGSCRACGLGLREGARFCDGCGAPTSVNSELVEYKQVTVMFADVVGSMNIAAALGAERLREIMAQLVERSAAVVHRFGGTVNQFTGDGFMAVFGAPAALEDHAFRACLAALDIQAEAKRLAAEVRLSDSIELELRVGLNSGQVVAGEIASGGFGYTTIGAHVGLAQRMESVAEPGGVVLSESTARLVDSVTVLDGPEMVHIKGTEAPVPSRRLIGVASKGPVSGRDVPLVGRSHEVEMLDTLLEQSVRGRGRVVGVVGSAGIGKSRIVREAAGMAAGQGADVFTTFCESHTNQVPFRVVAGLLRSVFGISELDGDAAREQVRSRIPNAHPEDLLLLDDLLGIGDPAVALPAITPDARRRRLAAMLNAAALARSTPTVYVIEDAHWIDEASESMLIEFVTVVPQTRSLVFITYRPEYRGALSRAPGAHSITLAPLSAAQTEALTTGLLGTHSSVTALASQIAERSSGNPFFADEIVRDLAERGVLDGDRGAYICRDNHADITVPDTLQAAIAARIDRLGAPAKHVLYASAVIGSRFETNLLSGVLGNTYDSGAAIAELLRVELIDQARFTPRAEYAFRHPLIRAVAYESQLKAGRAEMHRRVAAAIEENSPSSADQNAALIAEHLETAGDLRAAFDWHMRAGAWLSTRDRAAARISWQRARKVADRLAADDPYRMAMQIAPLTLLCGTLWLAGGRVADTGFEELRDLCTATGDQTSLAIGMAGLIMALAVHNRHHEASQLASELTGLVESIGDPDLTVGLLFAATHAKYSAGEVREALRLAQRVIDLSDGDPTKGNLIIGSPLTAAICMRGRTRQCLGINGWKSDADTAVATAAPLDPTCYVRAVMYKYGHAIGIGAQPADATALCETADALRIAEEAGDDYTLGLAQIARGQVLLRHDSPYREEGLHLLAQAREAAVKERFNMVALAMIDPEIASEKARNGDLDGALDLVRTVIDDEFDSGEMIFRGRATTVLVETLLQRGTDDDLHEAQAAIDRLAAVPTDPGFVLHELPLLRLRALAARAQGDEVAYREFIERYRAKAAAAGFEPLVAAADASAPPFPDITVHRGTP